MKLYATVVFRAMLAFLLFAASIASLFFRQHQIFLVLLLGSFGAGFLLLFDLFIYLSIRFGWFGENEPLQVAKDYYTSLNSVNNILLATSGVVISVLGSLADAKLLPMIAFGIVILFGAINANILAGSLQAQYTEELEDRGSKPSVDPKRVYEYVQLHPLHYSIVGFILNIQFTMFFLGIISVAVFSVRQSP